MSDSLGQIIGPTDAALLVIDKQAAYLDPELVAKRGKTLPSDHAELLARMDNFIDSARRAGVLVIWTCMTEDADLSPYPISHLITNNTNGFRHISKPGDPSYDFVGRTGPGKGEKVIDKRFYDAFAHTGLGEHLTNIGIKTVILVGGYATRCVLATAIGANSNGVYVVVPPDLVINQAHVAGEIPTLVGLVDAILGQTADSSEITRAWEQRNRR